MSPRQIAGVAFEGSFGGSLYKAENADDLIQDFSGDKTSGAGLDIFRVGH